MRIFAAMATILLLHGALGTARQMAPLAAALRDHRIIAPTLAGHGNDAGTPPAFDRFTADIDQALRDAEGLVHAIGYSMGGYAALLAEAGHPGRFATITTIGTKFIWTPEGVEKEVRKLDPDVIEQKVPRFAEALAAQHGANWKYLVRHTARLMHDLTATPLLPAERLAAITCPVLLCVGDRDTTAIPEDTLTTARHLPNAGTWVMPWTKHPFEEVDVESLVSRIRILLK